MRAFKQTVRGAATRRLLLDSTTQCLVDRGYAGASTTAICGQAGLTAGALFGQFPSKTALLVEVATDLVWQAAAQIEAAFADLPPALGDALVRAFDQLMQVWQTPIFKALSELWIAARTDTDLARALLAANATDRAMLVNLNRGLVAAGTPGSAAPALAQMVLYAVSGRTTIDDASRAVGGDPQIDEVLALQETFATVGAALDHWINSPGRDVTRRQPTPQPE